jgi:hypothetical protein
MPSVRKLGRDRAAISDWARSASIAINPHTDGAAILRRVLSKIITDCQGGWP